MLKKESCGVRRLANHQVRALWVCETPCAGFSSSFPDASR